MALVLSNEFVTPAELTGYVRAALADLPQNQSGIEQYLPDNLVDDIDYRASVGGGGLNSQASFRAWDAESPISGRKGIQNIRGELPPISEKRRLGEYDRLKMRRLDDGIRNALFNDAVELATRIRTRLLVAKGEALSYGKVTIEENGLFLEVDFGRKASHTQTAAQLFNAADSDPITQMLAWQSEYYATNGRRFGAAKTDQQVVTSLMRNQAIRNMVLPVGSTQQIVTVDAINALLQSFGLPALTVDEAVVEGADGAPQPIIPAGHILFLPADGAKIGETLWGTTAEALDADYGIDATEAPGLVIGSYSDKDPVGLWTKASAIALPIVPNTNLTFLAKVL